MESHALPLFRAGHIPVVGEWLALPLVALAGSTRVGDEAFTEVFHRSRSASWKSAMPSSASAARRVAPT